MTVASANAYINRMRDDQAFRQTVNAREDEANHWEFLRQNGYRFTMAEFKAAQAEIYNDFGITPL